MKIILSPSKKQNRDFNNEDIANKEIFLKKKSSYLRNLLENKSKEELGKILSIKGKLLNKVDNWYHKPDNKKNVSIGIYNGLVFKQLEIESYKMEDFEYLEKHLRILSALYGVLTPQTEINKYRLDMKSKIKDLSLKKYWKKEITSYFKNETLIVNLASKEFSSLINLREIDGEFIDIEFKELQLNGKLRTVASRAKKMRGLMVNWMVKNKINNRKSLKKFSALGYVYEEESSNNKKMYFIKNTNN